MKTLHEIHWISLQTNSGLPRYLFVLGLLLPRILADGWQHGLFQLHQRGAEVLERSFSCEYPGGTLNNQFLYGTPIHFCEKKIGIFCWVKQLLLW